EIRGKRIAAAHLRPFCDKPGDIGKLHQSYLACDDQIGTADIEVVAAAAGEVLELPARSAFPEIKLEAHALERIEKVLVHFLRLLGKWTRTFSMRSSAWASRRSLSIFFACSVRSLWLF